MRYQISFKNEDGVIRKQGCFTLHAARKIKRELRMNGVKATTVEIDERCAYCGSEYGWECVCSGKILAEGKPEHAPELLDHGFVSPEL